MLALIAANSPLLPLYREFCNAPVALEIGAFSVSTTLHHVINDGLMALFFLLIGLELKRNLVEGELSRRGAAVLPMAGAIGGVILPAALFLWFNAGTPTARGWAIPTATDIAFSLGIASLFGSRLPEGLRVFLLTLAVVDDLIAVLIIAAFYTEGISLHMLLASLALMALLFFMNRARVRRVRFYCFVGICLWYCVLLSGIHATVAGVALGLLMPLGGSRSPARRLEGNLHPWIAHFVMPIFAFVNAGVVLSGITMEDWLAPLTLGIGMGLFLGKQLGIFLACWLVIRLTRTEVPGGAGFMAFYGVCLIAGIGFTMSLFMGLLAFQNINNDMYMMHTRLGVLTGSLLSALVGYIVLHVALRRK